jgi:hypothetical protein
MLSFREGKGPFGGKRLCAHADDNGDGMLVRALVTSELATHPPEPEYRSRCSLMIARSQSGSGTVRRPELLFGLGHDLCPLISITVRITRLRPV